jgi:hypothetical protein
VAAVAGLGTVPALSGPAAIYCSVNQLIVASVGHRSLAVARHIFALVLP